MDDMPALFGSAYNQFSLKNLSGLSIWLRADLGITLNGSTVASWGDLSGNGRTVSQADPTKQPTFVASSSTFNGKPCVRSDGSNDVLASSVNVWPATSYTLMAVLATVSGSSGEYFANPGVGGNSPEHFYGAAETTFQRFNGVSKTLTSATKTIVTYTVSGANEALYVNGGGVVTGSSAPTASAALLNLFGVGATPLLPRSFNLAEFAIWSRVLASYEQRKGERYMGARYAITLA